MKIKEITEDYIMFDNGNTITYDHEHDCCEVNYADFMSITYDKVQYEDFKEELEFEFVDGFGFRFGSDVYWVAVPCYSEQNGYYTDEIDIYYNRKPVLKPVLSGRCCMRLG